MGKKKNVPYWRVNFLENDSTIIFIELFSISFCQFFWACKQKVDFLCYLD
jgi:hypothetical protein